MLINNEKDIAIKKEVYGGKYLYLAYETLIPKKNDLVVFDFKGNNPNIVYKVNNEYADSNLPLPKLVKNIESQGNKNFIIIYAKQNNTYYTALPI